MGRYYYGDISGKCWFGVQESDDASHFGVTPTRERVFLVCLCYVDDCKIGEKIYCTNCYDSYEDHINAIKEEEIENDSDITWMESNYCYQFDETDLPNVEKVVTTLENEVGLHTLKQYNFKIIKDEGEGITYDIDVTYQLGNNSIYEKLARLCLGKQIMYCISENGHCCFTVEL
jgi:hypothetical protein